VVIRPATHRDLPGILEIYNDVVATSTAIWAFEPATLEQRSEWFEARAKRGYPVLVAEDAGGIAGFASYGEFRSAPGYAWTVEHTVHVRSDRRRAGVGSGLVRALLPLARAQGMHVCLGGIAADNEASLRMHEKLGFERTAHLREVGRKFDRWLDLVLVQKTL